jgi:hypothetical protein
MLPKTMIVLAMAAALTGGLTADALARGGGGGGHGGGFGGGAHMGGFGGAHMGGGFGRGHFGGGRAFRRGFAGQHFAKASGRFGHDRHFGRRFAPGWGAPYGYYGDSVGYYGDGGYYDPSLLRPTSSPPIRLWLTPSSHPTNHSLPLRKAAAFELQHADLQGSVGERR